MGSYITTYTGKHLEPLNPDPDGICIEDIAHALSLVCRGNGHVKSFWSVGEHCICCAKEARARGLSNRLALACLLHDASECYLSDIPRPFKKSLPEYQKWEDALLDMIYLKFLGTPLTDDERWELKEIDDALLWYDLEHLLNERQAGERPQLHISLDYTVRPFLDVEREYIALYHDFSGMNQSKNISLDNVWEEIRSSYSKAKYALWCPKEAKSWYREEEVGRYYMWRAYHQAIKAEPKDELLFARILAMLGDETRITVSDYERYHKFLKPSLEAYERAFSAGQKPPEFDLTEENTVRNVAANTRCGTGGKHEVVYLPCQPFAGHILLAGINGHEKTGKHSCLIEKDKITTEPSYPCHAITAADRRVFGLRIPPAV